MAGHTTNKLSSEDIKEIQRRGLAGESASKICKDFDIAHSTATYHIAKVKKTKPMIKSETKPYHRKKTEKPKYIDMPLNTPKKVAVIITDSNSIAQVLGDLWK